MTPDVWIVILFTGGGLAIFITLIVLMRRHYTSESLYQANVGQPEKMDEMRDEQWDAIEDENAREHKDS